MLSLQQSQRSADWRTLPVAIRHRTHHEIVRLLDLRYRVSARLERNRIGVSGISVNGSLESIQTSPAASWTSSRLTNLSVSSLRAHVLIRLLSAVVGFGYSGRGKRPSSRETVLHPSYSSMAIPLYQGTKKYVFSRPLTQTEAFSGWGFQLFLTMSATLLLSLKSFQESRSSLYSKPFFWCVISQPLTSSAAWEGPQT